MVLLCAASGFEVRGQDLTECDDADAAIEFVADVAAELEVDDDVEIDLLQISVDISHESLMDLKLDITSPDGTTILLFDSSGLDETSLVVTWHDRGVDHGEDGFDCECEMQAEMGLAAFQGESTEGTWILDIVDSALAVENLQCPLDEGGDTDNLSLTFSDAGIALSEEDLNCSCAINPTGSDKLSEFGAEEGSFGEWTLEILDNEEGDEGFLESWCLDLIDNPIPEFGFLRGDTNGDGFFFGLLETLYLLRYAFANGPDLPCLEAADANNDGRVQPLVDAALLLNYTFNEGPAPPEPFPDCDQIEEDDDVNLGCEEPDEGCQ